MFEQVYRETYQVCRVTFGQEPKDDEILEILQTQFTQLSFSPEAIVKQQVNQKVSSKSKELLQLQYEERKKISKHQSSVQKQLLKQEKFERKQQKRREKHKGY